MSNLCHPESRIFLTDVVLFARNCSTNVKIFAEIWGHFLGPFLVPIFDPDWLSSYNLLHNQNLGSLFWVHFLDLKSDPAISHLYINECQQYCATNMKGDNHKCSRKRILHNFVYQLRPTQRRPLSLSPECWYFFGLNFDPEFLSFDTTLERNNLI